MRLLETLLDRHLALSGASFRLSGNRDDADDLAQEAFLRIWREARRWQPDRVLHDLAYRIPQSRHRPSSQSSRNWGIDLPELPPMAG
jgi:RNA polymerase sigma-70 factor (ECF subfamily)